MTNITRHQAALATLGANMRSLVERHDTSDITLGVEIDRLIRATVKAVIEGRQKNTQIAEELTKARKAFNRQLARRARR